MESKSIKKGNVKFIISYLIKNPDYYYTIESEIETVMLEPPDFQKSNNGEEESEYIKENKMDTISLECNSLNEKYKKLIAKYKGYTKSLSLVKSETHLKDSINSGELKSLIKSIDQFNFNECPIKKEEVLNIEAISKLFQHEIVIEKLQKGQEVSIHIKKFKKDSKEVVQEWKRIYKTPIKGRWVTSFGIGSAIPLQLNTFRAVENSDQTGYVLESDGRRNYFEYMPAIQFSYINNFSGDWEIAPSGGINLANNQIAAYGGISVVFAQNMIFTAGATFHSKYKLKNKYKEDDAFDTKLEFDDLHKKFYGISPFISLSFRLSSNPFSKGDNSNE